MRTLLSLVLFVQKIARLLKSVCVIICPMLFFVLKCVIPCLQSQLISCVCNSMAFADAKLTLFYFTNKDSPVISAGFSIPIISIKVGAISASLPPSLSVTPSL